MIARSALLNASGCKCGAYLPAWVVCIGFSIFDVGAIHESPDALCLLAGSSPYKSNCSQYRNNV